MKRDIIIENFVPWQFSSYVIMVLHVDFSQKFPLRVWYGSGRVENMTWQSELKLSHYLCNFKVEGVTSSLFKAYEI